MILKCIATGSSGNCYVLKAKNEEKLILDAGVTINKIKQGVDFDIRNIRGCLLTHHHMDHAKSEQDLQHIGLTVLNPYVADQHKNITVKLGSYTVTAFPLTDRNGDYCHTNNDGTACPCYGYMIKHEEIGKMLYITDTEFVKWRFSGVNHILLGVNYDSKFVDTEDPKKGHIYKGHMSIDTACRFVEANKTDALYNVIMCHLSGSNGDGTEFIKRMQGICSSSVSVAKAGKEWELKKTLCPF